METLDFLNVVYDLDNTVVQLLHTWYPSELECFLDDLLGDVPRKELGSFLDEVSSFELPLKPRSPVKCLISRIGQSDPILKTLLKHYDTNLCTLFLHFVL